MNSYQVIFTCKGVLTVFKETVQADSVEAAKAELKKLVKEAGLVLIHITAVIQLTKD